MSHFLKNNEYITGDHLNENGISLYVDGLILDRIKEIPNLILDHVEGCKKCKSEILALYEICKDNKEYKFQNHPYFAKKKTRKLLFLAIKIAASLFLIVSIGVIFFKI